MRAVMVTEKSPSRLPSIQTVPVLLLGGEEGAGFSQKLVLSLQVSNLAAKASDLFRRVLRRRLIIINSCSSSAFFCYPFTQKLLTKAQLYSNSFDCLASIDHDAGCITTIF